MTEPRNRFTLAFLDRDLEGAYRDHTARVVRRWLRLATWVVLFVYLANWFADPAIGGSPENGAAMRLVRLSVGAPLLSLAVGFTYTPWAVFRRAWAQVSVGVVVVLILCPVAQVWLMPDPGRLKLAAGSMSLIASLIAGFLLLPVRFINALVAGIVAIIPLAITLFDVDHPDAIAVLFFIVGGTAIAVLGALQAEVRDRIAFVANERADRLLRNVLPEPIAERLKTNSAARIADRFAEATVMFADMVGFTPLAQRLTPEELVAVLDEVFSAFDDIAARNGLEKIKTIGDAYMVVGGVPTARADHVEAIATMALEMRAMVLTRTFGDGQRLDMRIGIHTGPVVAGVIGKQKFIYDLWGETVNTASRMESHGLTGSIHVTESVHARLCDRFEFDARGAVQIKGMGEVQTWLLRGPTA